MPNSIAEACATLDTQKEGIPFEAIRYLRHQPTSDALVERIGFALRHAYDGTYYDPVEKWNYPAPLWYAIVAERHICEDLIDPVIGLFTATEEDDWDFLNEQGEYLLGALAEKYPETVMTKVTLAIDALIARKSKDAYLYLFDAFYYADAEKWKGWFLKTLQEKHLFWRDSFAHHIVDLHITEALPILRKIHAKEKEQWVRREFEECIEELELGHSLNPDMAMPHFKRRGNWEKHYRKLESRFYDTEEDDEGDEDAENDEVMVDAKSCMHNTPHTCMVKTGRNDPCPCQSGKKYKKCHGK